MGYLDNFTKWKIFEPSEPKTKERPRMGEMAVNESLLYGQNAFTKFNPDSLVGRKGLIVYDKMRVDDTVKSSLILKKYAVLAPNFRIVPATDDAQDIEIANYLEYCFEHMEGSIYDSILQILTALDFGYSITEINFDTFQEGEFAGMVGLKSLKTKYPHYYEFEVDQYSNIKKNGLIYNVGGDQKKLPLDKFVIYSYQKEFGNPYGNSDLRCAYRGYWSKDVLIKFWNIYLERFAMPTVVGQYASNDSSSVNNLRNILDNLSAKTSISHRMGEFDLKLLESSRNSTQEYQAALNFYNKMIARSILIPDRLFAEGETGAYAQSKIHFDVFLWVVEKLRQDIEEIVMKEQLVKRLISYNFKNVKKLPSFKFNPLTDEQKLALNNMFIDAVSKGVITKNDEDENYIRESLNFPLKNETSEKDVEDEGQQTPEPEPEPVEEEVEIEEKEEEVVENTYSPRDTALQNKVKEHNEKYTDKTKRATIGMLKKVYDRGVGAYRTNPQSVRPSVKSPEQWAMARVNSFLRALGSGRFGGGKHDTDLFPSGHPLKGEQKDNAIADVDLKPTEGMKVEADRGLAWRKEFKRGGTLVGVARANQLSNRENLSPSTVKRMYSFFSRHEVDKQGQGFKQGEKGYPSAGRIAWALWGGDAGFSWSTKKRNQLERETDNKKKYLHTIIEEQKESLKEFITKKFSKDELTIKFVKSGIDLKKKQAIKDEIKNKINNIEDSQSALIDIKVENCFDQHLSTVYIHLIDSITNKHEISTILSGIDEIYESDYIENLETLVE